MVSFNLFIHFFDIILHFVSTNEYTFVFIFFFFRIRNSFSTNYVTLTVQLNSPWLAIIQIPFNYSNKSSPVAAFVVCFYFFKLYIFTPLYSTSPSLSLSCGYITNFKVIFFKQQYICYVMPNIQLRKVLNLNIKNDQKNTFLWKTFSFTYFERDNHIQILTQHRCY